MGALILAFFDVCRFRLGPQDLPSSRFLLWTTLSVYCLFCMGLALIRFPLMAAVTIALVNGILMSVYALVVLHFCGVPERFTQTLSALAGTSLMISLIGMPTVIWVWLEPDKANPNHLPSLLWLGVFFWDLIVTAHIYRHAVSSYFALGFILAVVYTAALFKLLYHALPAALSL